MAIFAVSEVRAACIVIQFIDENGCKASLLKAKPKSTASREQIHDAQKFLLQSKIPQIITDYLAAKSRRKFAKHDV